MSTLHRSAVLSLFLASVSLNAGESTPHRDENGPIFAALAKSGEVCVVAKLTDGTTSGMVRAVRLKEHAKVQASLLSRLTPETYRLRYRFRCSPVVVLSTRSSDLLRELERDPDVVTLALDAQGQGSLDMSRKMIRADEVFDMGFTGEGRIVAVLDSGVDVTHPDLEAAIIHQKRFLDQGNEVNDDATDLAGHGTHVTGIIASRGKHAPRGVAPGSLIVAVKVLNDFNVGWISDWVAGVEHVTRLHEQDNGIQVDAINMSLESAVQYEGTCDGAREAMTAACNDALDLGIALIAASGNRPRQHIVDGVFVPAMSLPACITSVVSVGAVRDNGEMADFTARNWLLELLAPGETIQSAWRNGGVHTLDGTSQAAPHVTASSLLLRQIEPTLSPREVTDLMVVSGVPVDDPETGLTFPRLDVLGAVLTLTVHRRPYSRSDCNNDDRLDIADPVATLNWLFRGMPPPKCPDACDNDDDGTVSITDSVYILNFLFRGTEGPPPPFPDCGVDPTVDRNPCFASGCEG